MIYFVRHGQTDFNLFGVTQGQLDTSLNRTGLTQAEELAEKLKNYKFDVIFCSTLVRAVQTYKIISKHHKDTPVYFDGRIIESSRGILHGQKNPDEVYAEFFKDPHKFGGESDGDFYNRVSSFMKDIEKYRGKDILIVSHGGTLKHIRAYLAGNDPNRDVFVPCEVKNCEVIKIDF